MASLKFTDVGTASSFKTKGGSFLVQVDWLDKYSSAIVFQCILNQDVDGAPKCYAAFNKASPQDKNGGLDFLRNGTSNENATFSAAGNGWEWHGVVARPADKGFDVDKQPELKDRLQRYPVFQPGHKFYVSSTSSFAKPGLDDTDQAKYWDATTVSYGAITPPLKRLGVDLGDFGFAIRNDTGVSETFFYGDAGAQEKVGEMSTHLFRKLFPGNDQEGHPVTFIVFPGSRREQQDKEIQRRLWWYSQAENISELVDVMTMGQSFNTFRATGIQRLDPRTRQNILNTLIKQGQWRFFKDSQYDIGPAGKTPDYIKWIEWAKQRNG